MMWIFHAAAARTSPTPSIGWSRPSATPSRSNPASTIATSTISASSSCPPIIAGISSRATPPSKTWSLRPASTLALRFKENGQYLRSFVAEDSLFIDIMMNVGHHLLCRARDRRRKLRDIALRHCLTTRRVPGPRRRLHRARRHLRSGDRRVPAPDHPTGLSRRFLLVARPGLGAVRLRGVLRVQPRSALPRNRRSCADYYITYTPGRRRSAVGFQRAPRESQAARHLRGRHRRVRTVAPVPSDARSDEGPFLLVHRDSMSCERCARSTWPNRDKKWEGILKGGVYHIHKELGVDESVMWGEYFFVEALEEALARDGELAASPS